MVQTVLGPFGLYYSAVFLKPLAHIAVILILGLLTLKLVDSALKRIWTTLSSADASRITRLEQRTETLRRIVGSFGKIIIWAIAVLMIIKEFGIDTGPLLTGAGILGLAVGFGAQSLVKDVIAGFFILLDDQYGVGDGVRIGDQDGVVEHMTLRITILRNFEGHIHVIPNGSITSVTVMTRDWARAVVDITVPHKVEIGRLIGILETTGTQLVADLKEQVLDKPQILGIEKLSDEGATIRMAVKTLPSKRADVSREWRRLILESLDREGIELAQKHVL